MATYEHRELREIRALCKAMMSIVSNATRDHLAHEVRGRLRTLFELMNIDWSEDGEKVVAVRLAHCRGVDVKIPVRDWYSPEEARALADELLRAAHEADPENAPRMGGTSADR